MNYFLLLTALISLKYVQASAVITSVNVKSIFHYQRSSVPGCPLIDTSIVCVWFNEQCNNSDKKCPSDSICCADNCGSFCVKKNACATTAAPNKPTIGPVIPPDTEPKVGCPAIKSPLRCIFYNRRCDLETNEGCTDSDICCPDACGTSCRLPTYIVPSPVKGCPPINTEMLCIWYNEQCNDSDKKCPSDSICCGNNCGTFCVKKKTTCGCHTEPEKPSCGCHSNPGGPIKPTTGPAVHPACPPVDNSVQCVWFNEQCNETDKKCPADSICCGNNCGTSCIKKQSTCGCHTEPEKPSCGCHSKPVGPVKPTKRPVVHPACPPVDDSIKCIWYNEQCNDTDKKCPAGSVCCGNNCGTFCVKKPVKPGCSCHGEPAKPSCSCHGEPAKPICGCHSEPVIPTQGPITTPGVPDD